jgi:hypothetical protein
MLRATVDNQKRKRDAVPHMWCEDPYRLAASHYLEMGWEGPVPLPPKEKNDPPKGYTGAKNDWSKMSLSAVERFVEKARAGSNIGLWLAPGVIGIDVDHYTKTDRRGRKVVAKGGEELEGLEAEIGPLPDTWVSSARCDGRSGIRLFRCPEDMFIGGKLAKSIDLIHNGYRYAVVSPSWNKVSESYYRWYAPGADIDGSGQFEPPDFEELPELPPAWIDYIGQGQNHRHIKEKPLGPRSRAEVRIEEWIAEQKPGPLCSSMLSVVRRFEDTLEEHNIHDRLTAAIWQLLCMSQEGHPGLSDALDLVAAAHYTELAQDDSGHADRGGPQGIAEEFGRARAGGVKKLMTLIDEGHFEGMAGECYCIALGSDGEPQHEINVKAYKLSEQLEPCYAAIAATVEGEGVYLSSGNVTLYRNGRLSPLERDSLRVELDRKVYCYTYSKAEEMKFPAAPPDHLVNGLLRDASRFEHLPELDRFARAPFFAFDGGQVALVSAYGYHPAHRVYLDIDERMVAAMDQVDGDHVERALELLTRELLGDFPFVGPADRATALAALLLPFVRELIAGPTPLHFIEAPSPRSGKSLLTNAIAIVILGPERKGQAVMTAPTDSREWGKKLFASMLELPNMLVLDNVNGRMASPDLAAALTAYPSLSERILGQSKMGAPKNTALWLGTGNNISASDEVARRIVPCRIDAGMESPHRRTGFRHPRLMSWITEHRHALVWALLTLVQHWVNQGRPVGSKPLGGFEEWAEVVGGILESVGITELLANQDRFLSHAEDETESIVEFVRQWKNTYGAGRANKLVSKDFVTMLGLSQMIDLSPGKDPARAVGAYLRTYRDRVILGYRITVLKSKGTNYWALIKPTETVDRKPKGRTPNETKSRRVARGVYMRR